MRWYHWVPHADKTQKLGESYMPCKLFFAGRLNASHSLVVLYGTSAVRERVMATALLSKRGQEVGDKTAVRERILEAAFAAFMKSGYATASMLEIATRARVSKRELYAPVGNITGNADRQAIRRAR